MDVTEVLSNGSILAAALLAFAAGIVSFLSPCVLPLAPGYLSYITGLSAQEIGSNETGNVRTRSRVLLGAFGFILGFSIVFIAYGAAFGAAGSILLQWREPITRIMGLLVIFLGLSFMNVLPPLPFLNMDFRIHGKPRGTLIAAPLLGIMFGLGWSPCIGPTLAAVQSLAFSEASAWRGAFLSLLYCLGLGLPFIALALAFRFSMGAIGWVKRHYLVIMRIGGALLVLTGILLVTGLWDDVTTWMRVSLPGDYTTRL